MLSTRTRGAKLTNETLAAIRKALEGAGVEFTNGKKRGRGGEILCYRE
jgi:hypothetical protein